MQTRDRQKAFSLSLQADMEDVRWKISSYFALFFGESINLVEIIRL